MDTCDICGMKAIDCVGGTNYYCEAHENDVVDAHALRDVIDAQQLRYGYEPDNA